MPYNEQTGVNAVVVVALKPFNNQLNKVKTMEKCKYLLITTLSGALLLSSGMSMAAEEQIYGSQLMTTQERMEHRQNLQSASSEDERERIRQEHHERMKIRAREKGVSLPDEMPARGKGMGQGMGNGQGRGMGPGDGSGMGSGMGSGSGGGKNR